MAESQTPPLASRIRTALSGLAVTDAFGAHLEFHPRRHNPNTYIRDMLPNDNFSLPAGHFTDDTSMALCLAYSLTASSKTSEATSDSVDQASRYVMWLDDGYMSSTPGAAFDVGTQTRQALQYWRKRPSIETLDFVKGKFNEDWRCGNGSLMRVLPCALVAKSEEEAVELAGRSSEVTHPHQRCISACRVYAGLVFHALRGATKQELCEWLRKTLNTNMIDLDLRTKLEEYQNLGDWRAKKRADISSSGYVLDSIEASLWAFFGTETFEEGAIEVVNLGDDADTVGAIYGGLAGAYYGRMECIPERWFREMRRMDMIEKAVGRIIALHPKVGSDNEV